MLNFTVGPVMSSNLVNEIGGQQVPYFRTSEFSEVMLKNESLIKKFAKAAENYRVIFLTGSGTAAMEATVMNIFTEKDNVLIINGGGFGHRFVELCQIHGVSYTEIILPPGEVLSKETLYKYEKAGYTGLLVNVHETSTGVYYDIDMISRFCEENNIFLVVDAISSFLAYPFDMQKLKAGVMITGSQKALACPPGVSIIVLSSEAVDRINRNTNLRSLYFDLKIALKNGERGQTPFTPAVGILRQINARLLEIEKLGGAEEEIKRVSFIANDFRSKLCGLPFKYFSNSMSNAMTALHPLNQSAYNIFLKLKDEYNIWVCPNGGSLSDKVFRVGHIGALTQEDNLTLINAFKDMLKRGNL